LHELKDENPVLCNMNKIKIYFSLTSILSILLILGFLGCTKSKKISTAVTKDFNVVVILIDTLRADHLPFYGYSKNTAPFLDSISKKSIIFDKAFSTSSYTAPSVASIFTSLLPSQHGVTTGHFANLRLQKKNEETVTFDRIPLELTTIAEDMKLVGFKTFAVADNLNVSEEMQFNQGFDKFSMFRNEGAQKVNEQVKAWASEIKSSDRYFLYLHYMDPHEPYLERSPWFKSSNDKNQDQINAYDSEITYTDSHIKELSEIFNWDQNTLIVLIADHGEEFQDHGGFGHGKTLYKEVIHVPFVIFAPGISAQRIQSHVSTMDLLPTLAGLLNFPRKDLWMGNNLLPLIEENNKEDRFIISQLLRKAENPRAELKSVVSSDWHLITTKPKQMPMSYELFNVRTDFQQKTNEFKSKIEIAKVLEEKIASVGIEKVVKEETHFEKKITQEGLSELKSLGYAE